MILYINSNNIYLLNRSFSKILYFAKKDEIDYKKLVQLIGKNDVYIFINSFFSSLEHKIFTLNTKKQEIQSFIKKRFSKSDVLCAGYNNLFDKDKGAEHKNDIVVTIIKNNENEKHIKKVIESLLDTDIDLSHIYAFEQAISLIGVDFEYYSNVVSVNVVILKDGIIIAVLNSNHYIFCRFIRKRNNETIISSAVKVLSMTLKYIGTTYSFLPNDIKVTIMSDEQVDINEIKSSDAILKNISIETKNLGIQKNTIIDGVGADAVEIQLLKLVFTNIKYINNLTSPNLLIQTKAHKTIVILRIISFILLSFALLYGIYRYIVGTRLSYDDKKTEKLYIEIIQQTKNKRQNLVSFNEKVYEIIATNIAQNIADNSHMDMIKQIAKIFSKHRKLCFVESYRFNCEKCLEETRKNILYVDFALFNINLSTNFVFNELSKIEKEIIDFFKKNDYTVDVFFQQLSHDKRVALKKDVRDTMIITYYKREKQQTGR